MKQSLNNDFSSFNYKIVIFDEDISQMRVWLTAVKGLRNKHLIGSDKYKLFDEEIKRVKEFLKIHS